jgi:hypothetical protein
MIPRSLSCRGLVGCLNLKKLLLKISSANHPLPSRFAINSGTRKPSKWVEKSLWTLPIQIQLAASSIRGSKIMRSDAVDQQIRLASGYLRACIQDRPYRCGVQGTGELLAITASRIVSTSIIKKLVQPCRLTAPSNAPGSPARQIYVIANWSPDSR